MKHNSSTVKIFDHTLVVEWDKFTPGSSFFVPCINRNEVESWVRAQAWKMGIGVICKQVIENRKYGLRVWRTMR
jgi:hypothetical protein